MNKKIKNLLCLILVSILVAGCVAFAPPIPENYSFPQTAKVGLYVVASQYPKHTHYGTTIFNNFVKEYEYDWQMETTIEKIFTDKIKKSTRMEVLNLKDLNLGIDDGLNLVTIKNKDWSYVEENASLREKLLSQNISVVISIVEKPRLALLNCSNYGCTEFDSEGYGLFSKSFLFISRYLSAVSFDIEIEVLDPPIDLYNSIEFADNRGHEARNPEVVGFEPQDRENLTESELAPVKDGIVKYFEDLASLTVKYINK